MRFSRKFISQLSNHKTEGHGDYPFEVVNDYFTEMCDTGALRVILFRLPSTPEGFALRISGWTSSPYWEIYDENEAVLVPAKLTFV